MERRRPATMLVKTELTATKGKAMVVLLAEPPPDSMGSGHYHPGDEVVYILEGSITFTLC
jgi:quercetin dioxygenase-like cupin family protein